VINRYDISNPSCKRSMMFSQRDSAAEKLERIYFSEFSDVSEDMKAMANVVLGLTEYLELEYLK
jgi:hypothetical protein